MSSFRLKLSPEDVETVTQLRHDEQIGNDPYAALRFKAWLHRARDYGYSLQAIAAPLGLSRERIRQLANEAIDVDGVPPVRGVPRPPDPPPKSPKPRPTLSDAEREALVSLYSQASRLRNHPIGDPRRSASELVTSTLADLVESRGFTLRELGSILGVESQTIRARLKRHGFLGGPPPSQKAYRAPTERRPRKPAPRRRASNSSAARLAREAEKAATRERTMLRKMWKSLSDPQRACLTLIASDGPEGRSAHMIVTLQALTKKGLLIANGPARLTELGQKLVELSIPGSAPSPIDIGDKEAECGTYAGYLQHQRQRGRCCSPCREAAVAAMAPAQLQAAVIDRARIAAARENTSSGWRPR